MIIGKPRIAIRVVDIDALRWLQLTTQKIGTYSSQLVDLYRVSDTKFIVMTLKKIIMFDSRIEGFDKLFKFKDVNSSMVLFPFYDPWDLPYMIGDDTKIYDTRNKTCVGEVEGMESGVKTLGFMRNSTYLIASGEGHGLQMLSLEMTQRKSE